MISAIVIMISMVAIYMTATYKLPKEKPRHDDFNIEMRGANGAVSLEKKRYEAFGHNDDHRYMVVENTGVSDENQSDV